MRMAEFLVICERTENELLVPRVNRGDLLVAGILSVFIADWCCGTFGPTAAWVDNNTRHRTNRVLRKAALTVLPLEHYVGSG